MEKTGFKVVKKFEIINDGDMAMTVKSVAAYGTPGAGMTFKVDYPTKIDKQSAGAANLTITIPVTAPEGTHEGKLRIDAGKAGSQTITVKVTVKHAVKFDMSSYDPNFGRVDVLKSVPLEISLSETLGYKDVTAVKIQRKTTTVADGKDDWMAVNLPASIIQKGKTVPLTFTLRFRGETIVGRTYTWQYFLSHSEGNETITLKATAMPIDIEGTKSALATLLTIFVICTLIWTVFDSFLGMVMGYLSSMLRVIPSLGDGSIGACTFMDSSPVLSRVSVTVALPSRSLILHEPSDMVRPACAVPMSMTNIRNSSTTFLIVSPHPRAAYHRQHESI
jgi:hypothetical protein